MYSEEQALRKVINRRKKHIVILIMIVCVLLIMVLGVSLYFYMANLPLINIPMVSLSTEDWTRENIVLYVDSDQNKIKTYSFDGGKTWQTNRSITVTENGEYTIQVMDINDKLSKSTFVSITNIDREPPVLVFENSTTVQMGSNFSVRNGVQATDKESGISNNYTVVPDNIDMSVEGEYNLTYSVFDKAGNFVEKTRTIIVKDIKGRTYYRSRKVTTSNYKCEPYLCNCVTSSAIVEVGSCPTGYTLNDEKQCCQTCYKTCQSKTYSDWSDWQQKKIVANANTEVETIIVED